jgi:OmpA-OmpF porin, OOP family
MLRAAVSLFIIGILAFVLGLNNVGGLSIELGKMLFFVFVGLSILSYLVTLVTGRRVKNLVLLAGSLGLLNACGHGPSVQEYPDTASPGREVSTLDADVNAALENQTDVLAPYNFKEAQSSLNDAKNALEKQKSAKDILHNVAVGRGYLTRAGEFAKLSRTNLEEVAVARQEAVVANAPKLLKADFDRADEDLRAVTSDIEKNDLNKAKAKRTALQLTYLDLELKAIKQTRLGTSRDTIGQAEQEGAKDFAPRTLAVAIKSVQDTDAYITGNRHNESEIATRSEATRKATDHLLKITRNSKTGKKATAEDQALLLETEQDKTTHAQGQLDDKSDQLEIKKAQLAKGESANRTLTAVNVNLESDKALNQRFEDARKEFSDTEAEVYKQGNKLMIRLRGLEFPVSQSVIKGTNFPLLAKVQRVIYSFGKSSVVIEGHTDSLGEKAFNQKLSSARAVAVREYFVSNAGGQSMDIKAVGYGDQKPLATNKTLSGRAQNRRVDVVIQPEAAVN